MLPNCDWAKSACLLFILFGPFYTFPFFEYLFGTFCRKGVGEGVNVLQFSEVGGYVCLGRDFLDSLYLT